MGTQPRVIVVGGGLAGLAASVRVAEAGTPVDLFSVVPVKRSHSVCAQGGINACNKVARQQGYSEWQHMDETLYGGDFLNHQPPVYEMAHWAPKVIDLLDRMGVPFNRTREGERDLRLFGGSLFKRTHFSGASTGQQLLYALDEQTRRYEAEGKVTKYEFWEFLRPLINEDGDCKGIIAQDVRTMEIRAFPADAVVLATGGNGLMFGKSTMSVICTGAAAARAYRHGAWLGNPEFIQVHPTAIPGEDKCRLMSESARGEGGRVWVPRKKGDTRHPLEIPEEERLYFLEEKYPAYGNLVPRDIATREIFWKCQEGYGIGGGRMVYLDVSHLPTETKNKLKAILELYEKFTGDDPTEVPMKIFPSVHYTMGGLWTTYQEEWRDADPACDPSDRKTIVEDGKICGMKYGDPKNMVTNIPGLYAFGEVNYQYHGGTRLGANALLSCIFDGLYCGLSVANKAKADDSSKAADLPQSLIDKNIQEEKDLLAGLEANNGTNNPYEIHRVLGEEMTDSCTVIREEGRMLEARAKVAEIKEQYKSIKLSDTGSWTNQNLLFARALGDMIIYSDAVLETAIVRKESRGSHYRPDFPERNDEQFLKTTIAKYNPQSNTPDISFEDVPQPMVEPRARTYGSVETKKDDKKEAAAAK
ncbi:succinate dehydrogenase flavoprotein subunit [Mucisphaera calidilacus]|uniref:succinate dehydrogenase n=1 Tax=Mucisphaera calidilacus TaxID=2527982 RepID=A0A518BY56_9BACT|nr:succinate dehydrogenase flavoprotein subunit [Mucisphaera calidilacus]QDU71902.1 Fumarate reductase flavoprotein subunit [Mucisphaera calidilacus]